ncbi:DUF4360 domain-containing protein [Vogesella sp. GCM10023246]|uniref:DUF4360 domain-containing protein n=1 Tax=Vogesella oryzagri TaxID=3160864 RepID=A0ABV1M576_9NEIS
MTWMLRSLCACACAWLLCLPAAAQESNGCPEGSYSVVTSPDGTTLSILFSQFNIASRMNALSGAQRKVCHIASPLNLPAAHSIGVYKVDYRGFAKLAAKQEAGLAVQYFLGPHDNEHGRVFKRKIKGPHENDYLFTENIGAGQMKRVGCGATAMLDVSIELSLDGDRRAGEALASLDTTDAAPGAALVYHLNLKKCT